MKTPVLAPVKLFSFLKIFACTILHTFQLLTHENKIFLLREPAKQPRIEGVKGELRILPCQNVQNSGKGWFPHAFKIE